MLLFLLTTNLSRHISEKETEVERKRRQSGCHYPAPLIKYLSDDVNDEEEDDDSGDVRV